MPQFVLKDLMYITVQKFEKSLTFTMAAFFDQKDSKKVSLQP